MDHIFYDNQDDCTRIETIAQEIMIKTAQMELGVISKSARSLLFKHAKILRSEDSFKLLLCHIQNKLAEDASYFENRKQGDEEKLIRRINRVFFVVFYLFNHEEKKKKLDSLYGSFICILCEPLHDLIALKMRLLTENNFESGRAREMFEQGKQIVSLIDKIWPLYQCVPVLCKTDVEAMQYPLLSGKLSPLN